MRRRHRFQPEGTARLEERVVLNAHLRFGPVAIAQLNRSGQAPIGARESVLNQVNQAFTSFTQDYLQAAGTYFSTTGQDATALTLFRSYTRQRVNLLAQDLTRSMSRLPGSMNQVKSGSSGGNAIVLQTFLRTRIDGNGASSLVQALAPSRRATQSANVIPSPSADAATKSLFTNRATTSIETARAATVNAVNFLVNRTFH